MRALALVGLLLASPLNAADYQVTTNAAPFGEQPSSFREIDFPASHFIEKGQESTGSFSSEASSFDLKPMDEETRLKTENSLTALGARQEGKHIIVNLPADVLFDFDKSDIRPDARRVLSQLSETLVAMEPKKVLIVGHTDSKGSDEYNDKLSKRRAASVKSWLSKNGVTSSMVTEGKGERFPVAPNQTAQGADNPEGRQKNRRVEFVIGED